MIKIKINKNDIIEEVQRIGSLTKVPKIDTSSMTPGSQKHRLATDQNKVMVETNRNRNWLAKDIKDHRASRDRHRASGNDEAANLYDNAARFASLTDNKLSPTHAADNLSGQAKIDMQKNVVSKLKTAPRLTSSFNPNKQTHINLRNNI